MAGRKKAERMFIAGEKFNYVWKPAQVVKFIESYVDLVENGADKEETILTLAKWFKRKDNDVAILIMDLGERSYIAPTGRGYKFNKRHGVTSEDKSI